MIFPIGDTNVKGGSYPYFSYLFIGINILVFLYQISLGPELAHFYNVYGTVPSDFLEGLNKHSVITNMFLHGSLMHIAFNMLFLWIFSDNLEAIFGNFWFVIFYISGGAVASLAHVYFNQTSTIPSLGASGALSAIMGAYLVFFPKSKIKVLIIFLFKSFYVSAVYFLVLWFGIQLFSTFTEKVDPSSGGTAWWAHIGGFVFGVLIALILKKMKLVNPYKYYQKA